MDFSALARAEYAVRDHRERFTGWINYLGEEYRVDALISGGRVDEARYWDGEGLIAPEEYPALVDEFDRLTIKAWRAEKARTLKDAIEDWKRARRTA